MMAVFDDLHPRQMSVYTLLQDGWETDQIIAFEGADLLEIQEDLEANRTLLESVVNRFADRDSVYQDFLRMAEDSHNKFLLIYSPTHDHRKRVRRALANRARMAQMFEPMDYRRLVGDS